MSGSSRQRTMARRFASSAPTLEGGRRRACRGDVQPRDERDRPYPRSPRQEPQALGMTFTGSFSYACCGPSWRHSERRRQSASGGRRGRAGSPFPTGLPRKPQSRAGLPGLLLWNWFGQSCFDGQSRMSNALRRGVTGPRRSYITSARFSSSYCSTGRAHPALSTRPAASRAALGETP